MRNGMLTGVETMGLPNDPRLSADLLRSLAKILMPDLPHTLQISVEPGHGFCDGFRIRLMDSPNFLQAWELDDSRRRVVQTYVDEHFVVSRSDGFREVVTMGLELALRRLYEADDERRPQRPAGESTASVKVRRVVECGNCAASVQPKARKCGHCGSWFE